MGRPLLRPSGPESVTSLVWRYGYHEPAVSRFLERSLRPGDTFLDIGAHYGYFSLLAAHLVGPRGTVIAIEPTPSTFRQLQHNITANGYRNIEAHNVAACATASTLAFRDFGLALSALNTASSEARGVLRGRKQVHARQIEVKAVPADTIVAGRHVALIKIDTEGSEAGVLAGLGDTIARCRPALVVEHGGRDVRDLLPGYAATDVDGINLVLRLHS